MSRQLILDYLTPDRILLSGRAASKRGVLEELTALLGDNAPELSAAILSQLVEREAVMSTGIGHGVAIPHARLASCTSMRMALVRYPKGIDFGALDARPVFLAFAIIGPPQGTGLHVKLLARIARLVKEGKALQEIMRAASVDAVVDVLRQQDL